MREDGTWYLACAAIHPIKSCDHIISIYIVLNSQLLVPIIHAFNRSRDTTHAPRTGKMFTEE